MEVIISPEKLKAGDEQTFAAFYKAYISLFLAFALKFIPDEEISRDIVQDIFIDYLKRRSAFDELVQIKVFFYRSIRNRSLNLLAHRKTHDKYINHQEKEQLASQEYFLNHIIREETAFIIHREIEKLSETGQKVLQLAMDGKSNEEIAAQLSVSVNTVKTHKARSYAVLRKQLFNLRSLLISFIFY